MSSDTANGCMNSKQRRQQRNKETELCFRSALENSRPRALGNFNGNIIPVAKRAGKRPQVGRNGRIYLAQFTPHTELRGKARTERNWFNDPREVFVG